MEYDKFSKTDFLKEILKVLKKFNIAKEEIENDVPSNFWEAYAKVSSEYDEGMLERCNGNIDIVLLFAGLFSAINTAFIIAMQPDPGDLTNALLLQLIQISSNGSSVVQVPTLHAPTGYSSAPVWTQALAYASLSFSLLAAFGAVLGKQWLSYYKTNRYGSGSPEARCKERHYKFQALTTWQFQKILQSFPMLLQMSLLLFGVSIGAAMWTQQRSISILIITTTGFGFFCHVLTTVVSIIYPDCPFQTPLSSAIRAIVRYVHPGLHSQPPDEDSTASAMQWILETSTNPDVVRSVIELIPILSKQPDVNRLSLCEEVRDMFKACFDYCGNAIRPDSALAYGQALIRFAWGDLDAKNMLRGSTWEWNLWESWYALYLPWVFEQCAISYKRMMETENEHSHQHYQADLRTALRMAAATGMGGFAHPDDEDLIFDHRTPECCVWSKDALDSYKTVLANCVTHFNGINDLDVAGDALLLYRNLPGAINDLRPLFENVCRVTPRDSIATHHRWRHIVLDAICNYYDILIGCKEDLSMVLLYLFLDKDVSTEATNLLKYTEWPEDHDLQQISLPEIQSLVFRVLLTFSTFKVKNAAEFIPYCRTLARLMDADIHPAVSSIALNIAVKARNYLFRAAAEYDDSQRDTILSELSLALLTQASETQTDYLLLISTLARSPAWRDQLIKDGHAEWCNIIITPSLNDETCFYLAEFFLHIIFTNQEASCGIEELWFLVRGAWDCIASASFDSDLKPDQIEDQTVDILVRGTEMYIPKDFSEKDLKPFDECLDESLRVCRGRSSLQTVSAVEGLKDMIHRRLTAIILRSREAQTRVTREETETQSSS